MRMPMFRTIMAIVVSSSLSSPTMAQDEPVVGTNSMARLSNWIEATESELAWQKIPWLESFAPGVIAASKKQKPLLLWVMNGHPLGST